MIRKALRPAGLSDHKETEVRNELHIGKTKVAVPSYVYMLTYKPRSLRRLPAPEHYVRWRHFSRSDGSINHWSPSGSYS